MQDTKLAKRLSDTKFANGKWRREYSSTFRSLATRAYWKAHRAAERSEIARHCR